MSQQQQQLPYDFSGVDSGASLYQTQQTVPSSAQWPKASTGPAGLPYASAQLGSQLAYGDADLVNGGTQSRVEDWATQAVEATLQQVSIRSELVAAFV